MILVYSIILNVVGWMTAWSITTLAGWEWNPFMVFTYMVIGILIQGTLMKQREYIEH